MHVARVIGTVVASRKEPTLDGLTLLLLQGSEPSGEAKGSTYVVAVDAVGAGLGDLVLYASGSSARQTAITKDRPVDATVMGIIDLVEEQRELVYRKDGE